MDRGGSWATVHGVANSRTWLSTARQRRAEGGRGKTLKKDTQPIHRLASSSLLLWLLGTHTESLSLTVLLIYGWGRLVMGLWGWLSWKDRASHTMRLTWCQNPGWEEQPALPSGSKMVSSNTVATCGHVIWINKNEIIILSTYPIRRLAGTIRPVQNLTISIVIGSSIGQYGSEGPDLCAGLSEKSPLPWGLLPSGHTESGWARRPTTSRTPLKTVIGVRMKELVTVAQWGTTPRKTFAELGMPPWRTALCSSPGRVPAGEGGWENCSGWGTRGGCPGGSQHLQRQGAKVTFGKVTWYNLKGFTPQRSTYRGTLIFMEFVQRGPSGGERGLLRHRHEQPCPHQWNPSGYSHEEAQTPWDEGSTLEKMLCWRHPD